MNCKNNEWKYKMMYIPILYGKKKGSKCKENVEGNLSGNWHI